jgi:addiction module HigA family antidote
MSKNEKYFLNSSHAALSSFQSSGRITANMRFRLRLHPNCLWSQPTHPGTLLKEDVLVPLGLTITEAATDLGITRKTLSEFVNEKSSLSPEMAVRIAKATNTTPESWLNMQTKLDIWNAEQKQFNVIPFPDNSGSIHA